jgi:hypothetical protein
MTNSAVNFSFHHRRVATLAGRRVAAIQGSGYAYLMSKQGST